MSRAEPRLDEDAPHRSKKNTRRWCRGKPGTEHQVILTKHYWRREEPPPCRRWPWGREPRRWVCYHVDRCTLCGKILRHYGNDCPDYRPNGVARG